jgi:hypothetical protein
VAYATIAELAAALRITVTTANQAGLTACLEAAAIEIDDTLDRAADDPDPVDPNDPLLNRVNLLRGVEWFKANDAAFGVIGVSDTGTLQAPKNTFRRHSIALLPYKQQWGVA